MTQNISIYPLDTLFFGSGRSFTMGEDSWVEDLFPPFPSTLYGMLRANHFIANPANFKEAGGEKDPTKKLYIDNWGLGLEQNDAFTKLFPLPKDVIVLEEGKNFQLLELTPTEQEIISNYQGKEYKLVHSQEGKTGSPQRWYIDGDNLKAYLENKKINNAFKIADYMFHEPKIGIKRNPRDMSEKELYRINFSRLSSDPFQEKTKVGKLFFWVEIKDLAIDTNLLNRLGGEGKLIYFKENQVNNPTNQNIVYKKGDIIKILLTGPAYFDQVWKPCIENLEFLTAAMYRPIPKGGWDIQQRLPKPTAKIVPAGSVYYYRAKEDIKDFPYRLGTMQKEGFGNYISIKHEQKK